jgi:ABC-2 type transport system ATP-binding protein
MSTLAAPNSRRTPTRGSVPAVEVRDLCKDFRRRERRARFARRRRWPALAGVTFTVAHGECVAILGQNGSGKSTLVRLLSTLLVNDGGEARIFGRDALRETRAVRRLVNRVSVEASFFKKMSAAENLSYAALFYGMTPRQTRSEIPRILERVGFPPDRRDEAMEHLSRGMQQKVALAPVEDVKRRYHVETLEEAFFAATGRAFAEESGGGGGEREVFA